MLIGKLPPANPLLTLKPLMFKPAILVSGAVVLKPRVPVNVRPLNEPGVAIDAPAVAADCDALPELTCNTPLPLTVAMCVCEGILLVRMVTEFEPPTSPSVIGCRPAPVPIPSGRRPLRSGNAKLV